MGGTDNRQLRIQRATDDDISKEEHNYRPTRIAKTYGTSVQAILEANRAAYPSMTADFIKVGWVLKV